jgi:hypothetical protein
LTSIKACIADWDTKQPDDDDDDDDDGGDDDTDTGREDENGFSRQQLATTTGPAMHPAPPGIVAPDHVRITARAEIAFDLEQGIEALALLCLPRRRRRRRRRLRGRRRSSFFRPALFSCVLGTTRTRCHYSTTSPPRRWNYRRLAEGMYSCGKGQNDKEDNHCLAIFAPLRRCDVQCCGGWMSATIPSKTLGVLRRKKIKNRLKICIVLSPYAESNHGPLHYLVYSFFNILSIY